MKKKLLSVTALFAAVIIGVTVAFELSRRAVNAEEVRAEQLVALNEIRQLTQSDSELAAEKMDALENSLRGEELRQNGGGQGVIFCGICLVFLLTVFGYLYFAVCLPFDKMEAFAAAIANGNFEVPLAYERSNYFGQFTWAFDSMRREITKARACEREAVENNKTVIATLSHDIKTPIASIRAYAEGLEAGLDASPERRARYCNIIMRKCDEVATLTNDLFLHSLSDLDKLQINAERFEIGAFLKATIGEIAAEQDDICFIAPAFTVTVTADRKRLMQIAENLINNTRKYAKSPMEISLCRREGLIELHFRDYGGGIPDEDMPFIFEKFYRGQNCGGEQGSGLGLYIVKYLTEKMGGSVMLYNHANGLEAVVSLQEAVSDSQRE